MTTPEPDTPPNAEPAAARPVNIGPAQYILAALVVSQLTLTLRYSGWYFDLTRDGLVSIFPMGFGLPASICLYIATLSMLLKGSRGKLLFILAAAGLALTVPLWYSHWSLELSIVAAYGAALGVAGGRLARHSK